MNSTYTHPELGELYPDDVDWQSDSATVRFSDAPVEVCLANGTETGPSAVALAGYEWVAANWPQVLRSIENQAFDFYEPYAAGVPGTPGFDSPSELWGTEELLSILVFSKDDFSVSMRFAWQQASDPHIVTFYVENGVCETHSVDG